MAFFNSGSRALVEILTRLQSAERPMPVDHTFFEFGSIRYHVQASASDSENVYLSISTPSLSQEASRSSGLPESTLQEARKMYRKFAEIIEPPKEGYALTLKLNFSDLARPKDRVKAINQISSLQSVILSSQLRDMLGSLGSSGTMKLVYNQRDPFFVSRMPGMINAIFPMRFRDDTDLAIATSFFQELQDVGNSFSRAPRCSWSPIPPSELRGEYVQHLTTNGGFVSFGIFSRHVKGRRAAKTAWILLNFQSYVKYHIKCTRSYIQSRMRKRVETLTEVIQNARLRGNDDKRKLQVVPNLSLSPAKSLGENRVAGKKIISMISVSALALPSVSSRSLRTERHLFEQIEEVELDMRHAERRERQATAELDAAARTNEIHEEKLRMLDKKLKVKDGRIRVLEAIVNSP